MRINALRMTLCALVFGVADVAHADDLTLLRGPGAALIRLYDQIATQRLDLDPFYEAAGIRVSKRTCEIGARENERESCRREFCPMAEKLDLRIYCLYRADATIGASDLLIEGPPPVRTLTDYDSAWNVNQFLALEKKLGALGFVGLLRTLSMPGFERSGFFEFKPIKETLDGEIQVERWKRMADSPPGDCSAVFCTSINRLKLPNDITQSSILTILAECIRRRVGNVQGAPQYCVPIYFEGSKGTYVSALTSFRNERMTIGAGVISGRIYFTPKANSGTFEEVAQLLETAFTGPPLSFTTYRDPDAVVGVSGKRLSAVLANWHEQVTVRAIVSEVPLSVSDPGRGIQNFTGIQVGFATTLYVNNRNTMDDSEWRMPTRDQDQAFDAAVVSTVQSRAYQICPQASSQTNGRIVIVTCRPNGW